jgi:hypothetical protein
MAGGGSFWGEKNDEKEGKDGKEIPPVVCAAAPSDHATQLAIAQLKKPIRRNGPQILIIDTNSDLTPSDLTSTNLNEP